MRYVALLLIIALALLAPALAMPPAPEWDPRLDALGVTLQPAADCAQGCWRLASARFENEEESQGLHHIWARTLLDGQEVEGAPWNVAWPDGAASLVTKPPGEWADFPMFACFNPGEVGGYRAWAGENEDTSDVIAGMGLPSCHHVSFRLVWEWSEGGEEPTPTATPQPCVGCSGRVWLPLVGK